MRILLLLSGILSFIYFLRPDTFPTRKSIEDTLGISTISQAANIEIVRQAVLVHCINKGKVPDKLNDLYGDELTPEKFVDLDSSFVLNEEDNCQFSLQAKSK